VQLLLYMIFKTRLFKITIVSIFNLNICVFKGRISVLVAAPVITSTNHSARGWKFCEAKRKIRGV
jgi:hypothetical protein